MITNVLGLIGIRVAEKSVELHADIDSSLPLRLLGDPLRLMQILNNLLSNAVKFTQQGDIVLTVRGTERTRDTLQLKLVVQDTGVGMTKTNRPGSFRLLPRRTGRRRASSAVPDWDWPFVINSPTHGGQHSCAQPTGGRQHVHRATPL